MNLYFLGLLFIYLLSMIIIGYFQPFCSSMLDFFFAGRKISSLVLTASTFATIIGASSTVGLIGLAGQWGMPALWWLLSGSIGLLILRFFFLRRLFELTIFTVNDLIRHFYNPRIEKFSAGLIVFSWTGVIAAQLVASGKLMCSLFPGFSLSLSITIITSIILIYLLAGGQRAVLITDLVQAGFIFLGIFIVCAYLLTTTNFATIPPEQFRFPSNHSANLPAILSLLLILLPLYVFGPDIYSRFLCAGTPAQASRVLTLASVLILVIGIMICLIGVLGQAWYPHTDGENMIYLLIHHHFHPAIGSLIMLAFLAAFMSSADTSLMTCATIISMNLLNHFSPIRTKLILVVVAILSAFIANFYQSIIESLLLGYKIFSAGLAIPLLMPLCFRHQRFSSFSASISLMWGILIVLFQVIHPMLYPGIIIISSSLLVFCLAETGYRIFRFGRIFSPPQ